MMRPPFPHQVAGAERIVRQAKLLLADEVRCGKTRAVIDAAQELFRSGDIARVVVVTLGEVARTVWADPEEGQIAAFRNVPVRVRLVRSDKVRAWSTASTSGPALEWIVTNYELVRRPDRLRDMLPFASSKTLLVVDESWAVSNPTAQQTRAVYELARRCPRVVLLNGTPWGDNPGALYAQFKMLDPAIIGCADYLHFRAKYAVMGGFRRLRSVRDCEPTEDGTRCDTHERPLPCDRAGQWRKKFKPVQVVGWTNLEDLYDRTGPYVLRRTLAEVFPDLPPALDPVTVEVSLSPKTWERYRAMRDDAILELDSGRVISAAQAGIVATRLAQIAAGHVEDEVLSSEKIDGAAEWHARQLVADPSFRAIFWCRHRIEAERLAALLTHRVETRILYGGQDDEERAEAVRLMGPGCDRTRPGALVGIASTGGAGLDLSGAYVTAYVSNDWSLRVRQQSEGRTRGPNQKRPCYYYDFAACGPKGQRTVDHAAIRALRKKEDLAQWGADRWRKALRED